MTHVIGNVLVDKNDSNIIPLSERLQRVFHSLLPGILLHREEVAGVSCPVTNSSKEETGDGVLLWLLKRVTMKG